MHGTTDFPRSIQWDSYSCGPRTVYAITQHFGVATSYQQTFDDLGCTPENGVGGEALIRVLRTRGLAVRRETKLKVHAVKNALDQGAVIVAYVDDDHYVTVHGWSDDYVFVADPAVSRLLRQKQPTDDFIRRWNRWGLVVSARRRPRLPAEPRRERRP